MHLPWALNASCTWITQRGEPLKLELKNSLTSLWLLWLLLQVLASHHRHEVREISLVWYGLSDCLAFSHALMAALYIITLGARGWLNLMGPVPPVESCLLNRVLLNHVCWIVFVESCLVESCLVESQLLNRNSVESCLCRADQTWRAVANSSPRFYTHWPSKMLLSNFFLSGTGAKRSKSKKSFEHVYWNCKQWPHSCGASVAAFLASWHSTSGGLNSDIYFFAYVSVAIWLKRHAGFY